MIIGAGFVFAVGFVSAALLAGVAFLIYLKTKPAPSDPNLAAAIARVKASAGKVQGGTGKVETSTTTLEGIEPGE